MMAKLLAKAIQADFSRIKFTPDLMPSDVIGTSILNSRVNNLNLSKRFYFRQYCVD